MHHRHLSTPSQALYRVFVAPSVVPSSSFISPYTYPTARKQRPTCALTAIVRRTIYAYAKVIRPTTPHRKGTPVYDPSILLDERIGSLTAHLVSSDNKLGVLTPLARLLRQVDRATTHLRKVGETPAGAPIVKEWTKEALREEAIAKSKAEAAQGLKKSEEAHTKQVELTWAISENDRGYRIARLENFLREGRRVDVLIGPKKGSRPATRDDVADLLQIVRTAAKAIVGTKEWKAMEGNPGGQVVLHFHNEEQKELVKEEKLTKAGEAKVEKLERKAKEKEERREKQERRLQKKKEEELEKEKLRSTVVQ